jgi:hypothetical protein
VEWSFSVALVTKVVELLDEQAAAGSARSPELRPHLERRSFKEGFDFSVVELA